MQKLSKLVVLDGIDTTRPAGARRINDLPGIGGELLENLGSREAASLSDVWAKVKRRAAVAFVEQAEQKLVDYFGWSKTVYQAPAPLLTGGTKSQGLAVDSAGAPGVLAYVPNAPYVDILLDRVSVYIATQDLPAGAQLLVQVVELPSGEPATLVDANGDPVDLDLVDAVPGLNVLEIGARVVSAYAQAELFVAVRVSGGETLIPAFAGFQDFGLAAPTEIGLAPAVLVDGEVREAGAGFAPLALDLRVSCSLSQAIDRNPYEWSTPWLYLLGAEILAEKIRSPKTNYWSSGNLAIAEASRQELLGQFSSALNRVVKRQDVGALCADCTQLGGVSYETNLRA